MSSNQSWMRHYLGGLAHVHTRLSNYHGHRESDQSVRSYVSWLTAQGLLGPQAPWQYLIITNHTANPVRPWRLGLQGWRLRQLRHQATTAMVDGVPVWQGFESSLLPDGRADMPEVLRQRAAVVVASVHGGWAEMFADSTSRLMALQQACNLTEVDILGHPLRGVEATAASVDWQPLWRRAAATGTAIEVNINSYPTSEEPRWRQEAWQRWLTSLSQGPAQIWLGFDLHNHVQLERLYANWQSIDDPAVPNQLRDCLVALRAAGIEPERIINRGQKDWQAWFDKPKGERGNRL